MMMTTSSFFVMAFLLSLSAPSGTAHRPQPASERVTEVARLEFHSSFWLNLHHTLYAAAWSKRPAAGTLRALAGALPAALDAPLSDDERAAWQAAVDYYERDMASRNLLFDQRMARIKPLLARGDVGALAIGDDLRAVLQRAAPVYRRHYWAAHDRLNRAWIETTAKDLGQIASDVIPRLERWYGIKWFENPVRIDVVWIANRQGAYTTTEPTHAVIASGEPDHKGWTSVELVLHEVSHTLVYPLEREIARTLGDAITRHRELWHVVQFHLTGAAVQQALRARKVEYTPMLYQGLMDRAWPQYRAVIEQHWVPFVEEKITRDEAVSRTVKTLVK